MSAEVAIVAGTGGARGHATAATLAAVGRTVVAAGRNEQPLRDLPGLLVIATAQLMVVLDATIVNVALPHVQRALGFSGTGLEWVVNAYAVTFGGLRRPLPKPGTHPPASSTITP